MFFTVAVDVAGCLCQSGTSQRVQSEFWSCEEVLNGKRGQVLLHNGCRRGVDVSEGLAHSGGAQSKSCSLQATTAGCLVHVFPPGEFPSSYLQYYSPQLYESITARQASFLFVVLTPDESSRPLTS